MKSSGSMGKKRSTCLYLDTRVVETAKRVGLNVSRVSENALKTAIGRLSEPKLGTVLQSKARAEGRGRDSNPGARLHRPVGYQATSPPVTFRLMRTPFSTCNLGIITKLIFLSRNIV
jgi:post-segregation antitoxin (ccd killing protein)